MARPRKEINQKEFEKLCGMQCTKSEICAWFDTTEKTLESWCKRTYKEGFSQVFSQKRERGKISLRRSQWQLAERSATMAIFLGKQFLDQRDNVDVTVSDAKGIALDELERMVIRDDSGTGGGAADGNTD